MDLAESWTNLPPMKTARGASGQVNLTIPDTPSTGEPTSVTSTITMDSYVEFVEFVEVNVDFAHASYRNLEIELVSPSGAVSILAVPRKYLPVLLQMGQQLPVRVGQASWGGRRRNVDAPCERLVERRCRDAEIVEPPHLRPWNPARRTRLGIGDLGRNHPQCVLGCSRHDAGSSDHHGLRTPRYIKTSANDKSRRQLDRGGRMDVRETWNTPCRDWKAVSPMTYRCGPSTAWWQWQLVGYSSGHRKRNAPLPRNRHCCRRRTPCAQGHLDRPRSIRGPRKSPPTTFATLPPDLRDRPQLGYVIDNAWTYGHPGIQNFRHRRFK